MLNYKNFILPIAGLLSGIAAASLYLEDNPLEIVILFGGPGLVFAIFMTIAIFLSYNGKSRRWGIPLFLLISTVGYFVSVWGVIFLTNILLPGATAFFVAGLVGGGIMLMGLKIMLPVRWYDILNISILAGLLAWAAVWINYNIITEKNVYHSDMFTIGPYIETLNQSGLFLLHTLWNTIVAYLISTIILRKNTNV